MEPGNKISARTGTGAANAGRHSDLAAEPGSGAIVPAAPAHQKELSVDEKKAFIAALSQQIGLLGSNSKKPTPEQKVQIDHLSKALQDELIASRYQMTIERQVGGEAGFKKAVELLSLETECRKCLKVVQAVAPESVDKPDLRRRIGLVTAAANQTVSEIEKQAAANVDGPGMKALKAIPRTVEAVVDLTAGNLAYYGGGVSGFLCGKGWQWSEAGGVVIDSTRRFSNAFLGGSALGSNEQFAGSKLYQDYLAVTPVVQAGSVVGAGLEAVDKGYDSYQRMVWNAGREEKISPQQFAQIQEHDGLLRAGKVSLRTGEAAIGLALAAATGGGSLQGQLVAGGKALGVSTGFSAVGSVAQEIYVSQEEGEKFRTGRVAENTFSGTAQSLLFMGALGQATKQLAGASTAADFVRIRELRAAGEFAQAREVIGQIRLARASIGVAAKSIDIGDGSSDLHNTAEMYANAKNGLQIFAAVLQAGVNAADTSDVSLSGVLNSVSGRKHQSQSSQTIPAVGSLGADTGVSHLSSSRLDLPISAVPAPAELPATFRIGRLTSSSDYAVTSGGLPDGTINTKNYAAGVSVAKCSDALFEALAARGLAALDKDPALAPLCSAFAYRGGIPMLDGVIAPNTVVLRASLNSPDAAAKTVHELGHLLKNEGETSAVERENSFKARFEIPDQSGRSSRADSITPVGSAPAAGRGIYTAAELASSAGQSFSASIDPVSRDKLFGAIEKSAPTLSLSDRVNLIRLITSHSPEDGLSLGRTVGLSSAELVAGLTDSDTAHKHNGFIEKLNREAQSEKRRIDPGNVAAAEALDRSVNAGTARGPVQDRNFESPEAKDLSAQVNRYYSQLLALRSFKAVNQSTTDTPAVRAGEWALDMTDRALEGQHYSGPIYEYYKRTLAAKLPGLDLDVPVSASEWDKAAKLTAKAFAPGAPQPAPGQPLIPDGVRDTLARGLALDLRANSLVGDDQLKRISGFLQCHSDPEFQEILKKSQWKPLDLTYHALATGARDQLLTELRSDLNQRGVTPDRYEVVYDDSAKRYLIREKAGAVDPSLPTDSGSFFIPNKSFDPINIKLRIGSGKALVFDGDPQSPQMFHSGSSSGTATAGTLDYLIMSGERGSVEVHKNADGVFVQHFEKGGGTTRLGPYKGVSQSVREGASGWYCVVETMQGQEAVLWNGKELPASRYLPVVSDHPDGPIFVTSEPQGRRVGIGSKMSPYYKDIDAAGGNGGVARFVVQSNRGKWFAIEDGSEIGPYPSRIQFNGDQSHSILITASTWVRTGSGQFGPYKQVTDVVELKSPAAGPNSRSDIGYIALKPNGMWGVFCNNSELQEFKEKPGPLAANGSRLVYAGISPQGDKKIYKDRAVIASGIPANNGVVFSSYDSPVHLISTSVLYDVGGTRIQYPQHGPMIWSQSQLLRNFTVHTPAPGQHRVCMNGVPLGTCPEGGGDYRMVGAQVVGLTRLDNGLASISVDGKPLLHDLDVVFKCKTDSNDGTVAIVGTKNGSIAWRAWHLSGNNPSSSPTQDEQRKLDLLTLIENPSRAGIDDYFQRNQPSLPNSMNPVDRIRQAASESIGLARRITATVRGDPEPFLDDLGAKPGSTDNYSVRQNLRQIFPEIDANRRREEEQNQYGSIGSWLRGVGRSFGLFSGESRGKEETANPADYLGGRNTTALNGGDLGAAQRTAVPVMQLRTPQSGMFLTTVYGVFDSSAGGWQRTDLPVIGPQGGVMELTASIPVPTGVNEIVLPHLPGARVVTDRIRGVDAAGKEVKIPAQQSSTGGATVTPGPGISEVLYSQSVPQDAPLPENVTERNYNRFAADARRRLGPGGVDQIGTLPVEARMYVSSLKDQPPRDRLVAIESWVREKGHYDFENGKMSGVKDDLPPAELFKVMTARIEEVRRTHPEQRAELQGKIFSGVCADFAKLTAAMLRESGIVAGVAEGFRSNGIDPVITTAQFHAVAIAQWPAANGQTRLIPVDGTPGGVTQSQQGMLAQILQPTVLEREEKHRIEQERRRTETSEQLAQIETQLKSRDPEAIRALSNGRLEQVVNSALSLVTESQVDRLARAFDAGRWAGIDLLRANTGSGSPSRFSTSGPADSDQARTRSFMERAVGTVDRLSVGSSASGTGPASGAAMIKLFQDSIDGLERQYGDRTRAFEAAGQIVELARGGLDPIEYRSAIAVLTYLRAASVRGHP